MSNLIKDISENKPFGKTLRVLEVPATLIDNLHSRGTVKTPKEMEVHPNQPLVLKSGQQSVLAVVAKDPKKLIKANTQIEWFGVRGRNKEQILLQNLMDDPDIRCLVITGPAGTGKAQPLYSKVLTPKGWVSMGDLEEGMEVMTPSGDAATISGIFPQGTKDIYRVYFNDGAYADSCKEHLWFVSQDPLSQRNDEGETKELSEIIEDYQQCGQGAKYYIPVTEPLEYPEAHMEDDNSPYELGFFIGDRNKNGSENKNIPATIPEPYLLGSVSQRVQLLEGLIDSLLGPHQDASKQCLILPLVDLSDALVSDITRLVQSLGGTSEACDDEKALSVKLPEGITSYTTERPVRYIDRIEKIGEEEAQCIMVDHPDHLYITNNFIVTHNTTVVGSYALDQVTSQKGVEKLILSKPLEIVTKSRYWGTVPGDEGDKFSPFLKSYTILFENMTGDEGGAYVKTMLDNKVIEFMPLELMRGASLRDCICWYDEAQNLSHFEMLTLGSRLDDTGGSKLVLSGDLGQRDRNIKRNRTGIHKLVTSPHFLKSPHTAHIDLVQNERGTISQLFYDVFDDDPSKN